MSNSTIQLVCIESESRFNDQDANLPLERTTTTITIHHASNQYLHYTQRAGHRVTDTLQTIITQGRIRRRSRYEI